MDSRTQAKLVHNAANVVRIVAYPVAFIDGGRETHGGPPVVAETSGTGAVAEKLRSPPLLFHAEAAGPAGGSTLVKRLHTLTVERAIPARGRSPAHPKFACDLG